MVGMQYAVWVLHWDLFPGGVIHKRTCLVYRCRLDNHNWACFYTVEEAEAYLHGGAGRSAVIHCSRCT